MSPAHIFTEYAYFSSFSTTWVEHAGRYCGMIKKRLGLGAKGFVTRERAGRAYQYSATTSRAELIVATMLEALGTTTDRRSALVHFAGSVSAEEQSMLRAILNSGETGE